MNGFQRQTCNRGTSTLEFVVVLPTLLLVFFAIMELSRAWLTANMVTTASREGAREGSVTAPLDGDVFNATPAENRIDEILNSANMLAGSSKNVSCETPCVTGSQVQSNVTVTFDTVIPLFLPMLVDLEITRSTTMRYE